MKVLLLGKPFHGQTRSIDAVRERLELVVSDQPATKHCPPGQSAGVTPRRQLVVHYYRVRGNGMPDGALVYARDGYEPQPEDAELVRRAFG